MSLFHGHSAFPITPLTRDGAVDDGALARMLERMVDARVDSVGLLGSTGSYAYLDSDLRKRTTRVAVEALSGRLPLIVGVGALRTDTAEGLARDAADAGAAGLLMAPMSYAPLFAPEVFAHYRAVAMATDLPLCIYDNPSTTHFSFSQDLLGRLAAVRGIKAVKIPLPASGDPMAELTALRKVLPDDFTIGYSGMAGIATGLLAGADGWFSSLGGTLPDPANALTRAGLAGNTMGAEAAEAKLATLFEVMQDWGSLRVMHAAAGLLGLADAPLPRPLLPLDATAMDRLARALDDLD